MLHLYIFATTPNLLLSLLLKIFLPHLAMFSSCGPGSLTLIDVSGHQRQ